VHWSACGVWVSQCVCLSDETDESQCEVAGLTGDGWLRWAVAVRATARPLQGAAQGQEGQQAGAEASAEKCGSPRPAGAGAPDDPWAECFL
jgi:hypothetical protein